MDTNTQLISISDFRQKLGGLGRTSVYKIMSAGDVQTVKINRRRMIVSASAEDYIRRLIKHGEAR